MTIKTLKILLPFIFTTFILSCNQTEKKESNTKINENKSTIISTDKNKLGKLIDLNTYKPQKVKFKYVLIDNSGNNQRLTVPGPSERLLEAVLYFDSETFNKLIINNSKLSTISTGRKDVYDFDWLESDIKNELSKMDNYTDFPPHFFSSVGLTNGGYFMLNNKILLKLYSN